jgi:predicted nucleotidyltransferase
MSLSGRARILPGPFRATVDTASMDRVVTLTERKAAEAARRQRAVAELRRALDTCASAHGGRFLLFGSAASGKMRYDSDVDILVEFPPDRQAAAWNFAERACWDLRLPPDIMASAWCTEDFLALVRPDAHVLRAPAPGTEVPGE